MHWVAQAPDITYCVERQARGQDGNLTHCTLIAPPEEGDPARVGMSLSDKYPRDNTWLAPTCGVCADRGRLKPREVPHLL